MIISFHGKNEGKSRAYRQVLCLGIQQKLVGLELEIIPVVTETKSWGKSCQQDLKMKYRGDFPGGPVAKILCSQCRELWFYPRSVN